MNSQRITMDLTKLTEAGFNWIEPLMWDVINKNTGEVIFEKETTPDLADVYDWEERCQNSGENPNDIFICDRSVDEGYDKHMARFDKRMVAIGKRIDGEEVKAVDPSGFAYHADDDSEMIKNGQCQMCGHSVTEGHNCWDGRYASDMIYLKPSQMMKRSDNIITKLPIKKGE